MRYLFTTIPGPSHVLPMVPLAHAALAAGHEVLFATSGEAALRTAKSAGLHTFAVDDGQAAAPYEEMARKVSETTITSDLPINELIGYFAGVFAEVGSRMADALIEAGRTWGADAVVYPPPHVGGLLAARALGIPAVLHGIGTRRPTFGPALAALRPTAERLGVTELPEAEVEIDLSPASLETIHQDTPHQARAGHTLPMRYIAYTGGAVLPDWLLQRGPRPRVAVTLGSLPAIYGDGALLREIIEGARELDVELVVTTGGAELSALPSPLPPYVRVVDWLPLKALLATCDAVVHHGGMGSVYASLDAGVPQLAIPVTGTDSVANAQVAVARGAGRLLDIADARAATVASALREVLHTPSYREAGRQVSAEMRAMPAPATVVAELSALLGAAG
ncbi:nucleotide disphospho-sugar-binding domain-containing protein [Streptomyces sp. NPDC015346]|uniref:nucleotide disphospho-sugar-binding domain-containing protein n=1 Tax=Streptomyces sp. NPDC015346 TaxID=3364954 RepID=UPI0036FE91B6